MRILVVEDDLKISQFVREGLEADGNLVTAAHDGRDGLELALKGDFDLIVLDMMLPTLSGSELLESLRKVDNQVFVICLTAMTEVSDRVEALEHGADDYLTKPFSFVELRARIRSLFRRSADAKPMTRTVRGLFIDSRLRRVSFEGQQVDLSARELRLLEYLAQTPDEPVTRAMIADRVWGYQFDTGTNVIDVYISYLRRKLSRIGVSPILTVRGIGYLLDSAACDPSDTTS